MASTLTLSLSLTLTLVPAGCAAAQGADPTRPPPQLLSADPAASPPQPQPRLQALRLGPGLRAAAVIDGRLVHEGDRLHERFKVMTITSTGVLLRPLEAASGPQWLRFAGDIRKEKRS
jgi:hypothetical protein